MLLAGGWAAAVAGSARLVPRRLLKLRGFGVGGGGFGVLGCFGYSLKFRVLVLDI